MNLFPHRGPSLITSTVTAGAVALAALAVANSVAARRAERRHPPEGSFLDVRGTRLHYSDRGQGSPVVLIHGNMVTGDDFNTSGVSDLLLKHHRVIIFDRPGFGYSERPRTRVWTASQQADLLHEALQQLGVVRPIVVGHSWGAIVAMAMASRHQADVAGIVALSGYYFWTVRPDILLVGAGATPIIGDILRYTVSPVVNRLLMPLVKRALFSPAPVPARFEADYSVGLAVRPSQLRSTAEDGTLMIPGALALRNDYKKLTLPVTIMAGADDKVVFARGAKRLHETIPGSKLHLLPRVGHMVHYQVPDAVSEAVEAIMTRLQDERPKIANPMRAAPTSKAA